MDLRKEQLILGCCLSMERVEALLTNETIEAKFRKLGEDKRVKEASSELSDRIKEWQDLAQRYVQEGGEVDPFEEVLRCVKLNCIELTIGMNANAIIFEGRRVQEVVENNLTAVLYLEELWDAIQETKHMIYAAGIVSSIKQFVESSEEA